VAAGALILAGLGLAGCGGKGASGTAQRSTRATSGTSRVAGASAKALRRSPPVKVDIPKIDVHAPVTLLGLKSDGSIEEPPLSKPNLTGWYKLGPTPGEKGPAVIAGHVDAHGGPAVFYKLGHLRRGDRAEITRKDGSVAVFRIDTVERVPKNAFPTKKVYGDLGFPGLRLITCGGGFNQATGHYLDNIIAYGHLVSSQRR
jgi:sortase (surface protein transpeptidase)